MALRPTRVALVTASLVLLAPCASWYLLRMPVVTVRNAADGAEVRDVRLWSEGDWGRSRPGSIALVRPGESRSVRLWVQGPGALRMDYAGGSGKRTLAGRCPVEPGGTVTVEVTAAGTPVEAPCGAAAAGP